MSDIITPVRRWLLSLRMRELRQLCEEFLWNLRVFSNEMTREQLIDALEDYILEP